ncbi:uncharacterized protein LOC118349692 [Juglans regia]|uniref:Uncharacterized protein LOC118349692 n=1 Tax=Juglans regia TaxID=51240 RepID=A0A6P9F911_JUGRE|nr:uncharacterized protein LOC118349692 [Juglans regia]
MAEGTRATLKVQFEESQRQQGMMQQQLEQNQQAISGITERLEQVSDLLKSVVDSVNVMSRRDREVSNDTRNHEERGVFQRNIRLDFPHFSGRDPAGWTFKANQHFDCFQVPFHQKLMVASHHMEGEALVWYQSAFESGQFNSWETLVVAMQGRFGPSAFDDPMEALTRLRQTTSVSLYTSQFEALSNRLKGLSDKHKMSCFISGLKDDIQIPVKMFNPLNLGAAFSLAKLQEEHVLSSRKSWRQNSHFAEKWPLNSVGMTDLANNAPKNVFPMRRVNSSHMDEKRKKGLCFHCEEKWNPNHVCKNPRVYFLHGEPSDMQEEIDNEDEVVPQSLQSSKELVLKGVEELEVSIHAISGCINSNAMKLLGTIGSFSVEILVDSGSTHNFLDPLVVEATKLRVMEDGALQVKVADGTSIVSQGKCEEMIKVQGTKFLVPFHVLTLGGCDIVLGVQWLKTLGPIQWDFTNMSMQFEIAGQQLFLQGLLSGQVQVDAGIRMLKSSFIGQQGWLLQLVAVQPKLEPTQTLPAVEEVVNQFQSVFEEPVGLPPPRAFDHRIILKEGTPPISVRPYRYPHYQKTEIEKIVKDLLLNGVIRPSQNPFSSPVLLVKIVDGTWRMCMDYRALNQETVKDKFPIPVIDELLDELYRASQDLFQHLEHLKTVLSVLQQQTLFAKKSKCKFGVMEVDYLGHIISAEGVRADPSKISAMIEWPVPKTVKALRGFLGLTGYYRKLIKGYGSIAAPLTMLLKKNSFVWGEEAEKAFLQLKHAVAHPPVLKLPDFSQAFLIECDASGVGLGAVLMQNSQPIAYFSKALKGKALLLSTYEKELLALVSALGKYRPYLLGQPFKIKTDQQALKHLLE